MCGILATIGNHEVDRDSLTRWNDLTVHRGPDGSGVWIADGVGLAHRRLSILDLSENGAQPMRRSIEKGWECVITYNGEIYNYRELRTELEGLGETFSSGTDTEVVLAAYRQWGTRCVERFNGMWAFALFDAAKKRVFCSRDRFGIKPLYFHRQGKTLVVSSEIRQLLPLLPKRSVHKEVLYDYLVAGFLEHRDDTFFEGVEKLPGGHNILHDLETCEFRIERWYRLAQNDEFASLSLEDATGKVRDLLESSIELRLRADVKVGTCLSGGIDSSAIASLAGRRYRDQTGEAFHAIHARGSDQESDESEFASKVAEERGLELHFVDPTYENFAASLDKVVETQEEPFGGTSIFMQYFVMQKAREIGCPVMLDGQGGDEVFLGYERYFPAAFLNTARALPFGLAAEVLSARQNNAGMSWKGMARYCIGSSFGGLRYRVHRREVSFLNSRISDGIRLLSELTQAYRDPFELQRLEIERSNLPALLRYEDKNSMAHSIEARVPFLDYRLVELAAGLSCPCKMRKGWTKYVLRKAVEDIVPAENLWRKEKFGFNSPHADWMKRHHDRALEEIGESAILRRFCDMDSLLRKFGSLSPTTRWRFYNLAVWERIFGVSAP